MKTVELMGEQIEVVEHFKEIQEVCGYPELFKRWYNRGQFLKAITGISSYNGEVEPIENVEIGGDGFYGTCLGCIEWENDRGCGGIALYDTEDMTEEGLNDALEFAWDSFFMEGKNGKIYFVNVNID